MRPFQRLGWYNLNVEAVNGVGGKVMMIGICRANGKISEGKNGSQYKVQPAAFLGSPCYFLNSFGCNPLQPAGQHLMGLFPCIPSPYSLPSLSSPSSRPAALLVNVTSLGRTDRERSTSLGRTFLWCSTFAVGELGPELKWIFLLVTMTMSLPTAPWTSLARRKGLDDCTSSLAHQFTSPSVEHSCRPCSVLLVGLLLSHG